MLARRWPLLAIAGVALVLLAGRALAGLYADYAWYDAMGAGALWRERTVLTIALRLGSGLLAGVFVFANLYAVRHSVVSLVLPRRVANLEIGEEVPGSYLVGAALVISIVLGWVLALPNESWRSLALLRHGIAFNEPDPYFDADLGFFVYWVPFETLLHVTALIAVLLVSAVVIFFYALTPSLRWERGSLYVSNYVRRHLVVLCSALLVLLSWNYRLDIYRTLFAGSGPEGLFTYSDHRAVIPVSIWLAFITFAAACVVLYFGWVGQVRVAAVAIGGVLVLAFGLRHIVPALVRHYAYVGSPELRERPYERTRVDYTRRAYALARIGTADSALRYPSAREAASAISLWDPTALTRAVRAGHAGGVPIGIAWSTGTNGLVAGVTERRNGSVQDETPPSWVITPVLASTADAAGEPVHATTTSGRDEIHFDSVLVADSLRGYSLVVDGVTHYPAPALRGTLSRLAHAWSQQDFRLLFGDLPRGTVRIVTHRDVRERVDALAPFFAQGSVVAPVVAQDTLYWIIDLYAVSESYPLSAHDTLAGEPVSYAHHAGTTVVNAETGRTVIVADSVRDPVTESWVNAYPTLFASWSALPNAIASALPPAVDGARLQARVFARFGMRLELPRLGSVPEASGADSVIDAGPPTYFALPGGDRLAWSSAVLDSSSHLSGIFVAMGGAAHAARWMPLPTPGPRWSAIADPLRRALDTTALPPRDAKGYRGRVRAIPLADGIALAQPAFAWHPESASLLRVALELPDGTVSTGRTLSDAAGGSRADTAELEPQDFRARVGQLYDQMRAALQRGDWESFGRAYTALGTLLGRRGPRP